MRCIRKNCKNYAEIHPLYGTIPCEACRQEKDGSIPSRRKFQFANIGKLHRVQAQRDAHLADLLQPFEGNRRIFNFLKIILTRLTIIKSEGNWRKYEV